VAEVAEETFVHVEVDARGEVDEPVEEQVVDTDDDIKIVGEVVAERRGRRRTGRDIDDDGIMILRSRDEEFVEDSYLENGHF
jgi:hypothetical protein